MVTAIFHKGNTVLRLKILPIMPASIMLALLVPAFAWAETDVPVIFADCREGGCNCTETSLSIAEVEILVEAEMPSGMDQPVVMDMNDGTGLSWSNVPTSELDAIWGGNGDCDIPMPLDGVWESQSRYISISCGDATAMLRAMTEPYLNDDAAPRVVWGGVFDGEIYQRAWMVANPDSENVLAPSRQISRTVSEATVTVSGEEGVLETRYRFELLSPSLFRGDWHVKSQINGQPCNWHVRSMVRRISD